MYGIEYVLYMYGIEYVLYMYGIEYVLYWQGLYRICIDMDAIDIVPALVVTDQNNGEIQLIKFMADMWKLYLNL